MRVLLIYPNIHNTSRINLGLAYLSACLNKAGHEVRLFDTTFYKEDGSFSEDTLRGKTLQVKDIDLTKHGVVYRSADLMLQDFRALIDSFGPDVLALSCIDSTYQLGKKLLEHVRHLGIFTVVGGARPSVDPESIISEYWLDAVCIGEGEKALVELCNKLNSSNIENIKNLWVKNKNNVIKNELNMLADVNNLPEPDWDIFSDFHLIRPFAGEVYRMGVFDMSRGCPCMCTYCINQHYANLYKNCGRYVRQKDPFGMVKEIKRKVEKHKLNFVMFYDDMFPTKRDIDRFCEAYKEIGLPFYINLRPEAVKSEIIEKLFNVGLCSIGVGIESGDSEFRQKVLKRNYSNQTVVDAFNNIKKYNIRTSTFNIIGFPFETRENIFKTIKLNKIVRPTSATVSYFYPYRGTPLRKVCIENNLFNEKEEEELDISHRIGSALNMPQMSSEELSAIMMRFQLYVKLPQIAWPLIKMSEKDMLIGRFLYKVLTSVHSMIAEKSSRWVFEVKKEKVNEF